MEAGAEPEGIALQRQVGPGGLLSRDRTEARRRVWGQHSHPPLGTRTGSSSVAGNQLPENQFAKNLNLSSDQLAP